MPVIPIPEPRRYSEDGISPYSILDTFLDNRHVDFHIWGDDAEAEWQVSACITPENHILTANCLPEDKSEADYVFKDIESATPVWLEKSVFVSANCQGVDLEKEAKRQFWPNLIQNLEVDFLNPLFTAAGAAVGPLPPLEAYLEAVRLGNSQYAPYGLVLIVDAVVEGFLWDANLLRVEEGPNGRNVLKDVWGNTVARTRWEGSFQSVIAVWDPQFSIWLSDWIIQTPPADAIALTNEKLLRVERGYLIAQSFCDAVRVDWCHNNCVS